MTATCSQRSLGGYMSCWRTMACSICAKRSLTASSVPPKRGLGCRPHQEGQGHQDHDHGRCEWHATRSSHRQRQPGGGQARSGHDELHGHSVLARPCCGRAEQSGASNFGGEGTPRRKSGLAKSLATRLTDPPSCIGRELPLLFGALVNWLNPARVHLLLQVRT